MRQVYCLLPMVFSYPVWYLALCASIGLLLALALYFRDRNLAEAGWRRWVSLLALLRCLSVTAIAILLLSPVLRYKQIDKEKPIVLLAVDNSASLNRAMDSVQLEQIRVQLEQIRQDLDEDFEVRAFRFDEALKESDYESLEFGGSSTDLSSVLDGLYDRFSGRNVGALVLASDGIYNTGSNPAYSGRRLPAPIFTIALGDTAVRRDLVISRTYANKLVYLGDRFSLRVDWKALESRGMDSRLKVERIRNGRAELLDQRSVNIAGNLYDADEEFVLEANETGVLQFRVSIDPVDGESTRVNNARDVFVDVLDARQKILILAHAPHPDIAAFQQALEKNRNYEIEVALASDVVNTNKVTPTDFDLIVLHQLPTLMFPSSELLSQVQEENIPALFVLGSMTNLEALPQAQNLVRIRAGRGASTNDVQGTFNPDFPLFQIDPKVASEIRALPPLKAPFGDYRTGPEGVTLLTQRIGTVDTQYPLLVFGQGSRARTGVLTGEGIWRWRLIDYLENGSHEHVDELISKTVQYLSVKGDRRQFRTTLDKRVYGENERIEFGAELYNESYDPVNTPDVDLVISEIMQDTGGRDFEYRFDRRGNTYELDAGSLPPGSYRYRAATSLGGENFSSEGIFSVAPLQLESVRLRADHGLLAELSASSNGLLISSDQIADIPELLGNRKEIRPVLRESVRTREVIHLKYIFFGLLTLLGLEWFLRKLSGGY